MYEVISILNISNNNKIQRFKVLKASDFLVEHQLYEKQISTLIQLSQQKYKRNIFTMEQTLIQLQASHQDFEVHSNSCCQAIVKSKKISNPETLSLSPHKKNSQNAKERGIKLTSTKSSTLLNSTKKIKIDEKTTIWGSSYKVHLQKINQTLPIRSAKQLENMNSNSTKKCIEYKNRRIVQRTNTQSSYFQTYNTDNLAQKSKKNIEEYTPRTTIKADQQNSQEIIDKIHQFSMILTNKKKNISETENKKLFFKPSKGNKTLSRLYQQQLGRRVVTVQSQQDDCESERLSIIEPFQWRIELN